MRWCHRWVSGVFGSVDMMLRRTLMTSVERALIRASKAEFKWSVISELTRTGWRLETRFPHMIKNMPRSLALCVFIPSPSCHHVHLGPVCWFSLYWWKFNILHQNVHTLQIFYYQSSSYLLLDLLNAIRFFFVVGGNHSFLILILVPSQILLKDLIKCFNKKRVWFCTSAAQQNMMLLLLFFV